MKHIIKSKITHYLLGYGISWVIIWLLFCIIKENL